MQKVLIVEDDDVLRRSISRWIQRNSKCEVIECATLAEGRAALDQFPSAAIIDVGLPDGNGLDLLAMLRRQSPSANVLILTGSSSASVANRAHLLDAVVVRKPCLDANLSRFVSRLADRRDAQKSWTLEEAVDEIAGRLGLSNQQRRIVLLRASGVKRSELADALQLTEATIRSHIRALVVRAEVDSLDQFAWLIVDLIA
jgi:two-component system response regulator DesR